MDFVKIKQQLMLVLIDAKAQERKGDLYIYKMLLERLTESEADTFMLSSHGGYTPGQLNRIKKLLKGKFSSN